MQIYRFLIRGEGTFGLVLRAKSEQRGYRCAFLIALRRGWEPYEVMEV